jgi:Phage tail tube protein
VTTQLDSSIGIKKESTWSTAVVPDHFPEFLSETLDWKPSYIVGKGLRAGSRVSRVERRTLGKNWVEGDIELECAARGIGIFFEALMGKVTSTQIAAGPAYQHNFTLTDTDPFPSYTIQKGLPIMNGGAVQPHTFAGAACTRGSISTSGETLVLRSSWWAKSVDTATAYAAPSYIVTGQELFNFFQGTITLGGTIVNPTASTLATGGTVVSNVRDFSLDIDNKLDTQGFTFGSGGKAGRRPHVGYTDISGKFTAEFDAVTYRDLYLSNTSISCTLTFTTATLLQTGVFNTLQIVIPNLKLDGDIPNATTEGVITLDIPFTVLDGGTPGVPPVSIILRNLDTVP